MNTVLIMCMMKLKDLTVEEEVPLRYTLKNISDEQVSQWKSYRLIDYKDQYGTQLTIPFANVQSLMVVPQGAPPSKTISASHPSAAPG